MRKLTILALGGAGKNFLNSFEKKFKINILDIEFNLCHLEDESFNKLNLEKSINHSSEIFVIFGIGNNSKLSFVLADILKNSSIISNFIVLKPFYFEGNDKLNLFETISKQLSNKVQNLKIIDCNTISSQFLDKNPSIQDMFLNVDKHILEYILEK